MGSNPKPISRKNSANQRVDPAADHKCNASGFIGRIVHIYLPRFFNQSNNFFGVQVLITSFGSSQARRAVATP